MQEPLTARFIGQSISFQPRATNCISSEKMLQTRKTTSGIKVPCQTHVAVKMWQEDPSESMISAFRIWGPRSSDVLGLQILTGKEERGLLGRGPC